MKSNILKTTICALLLTAGTGWAASVTPVIREIRLRNMGAGRLDEQFVRSHLTILVGADLDRGQVNKDLRGLLETRRFSDVTVDAESGDDGVILVFLIRNRLKVVKPVEIVGAKEFSESTIRDTLGVLPGDYVDDPSMGVAAQKLKDKYHEELYPEAKVAWTIAETDHAEGFATVKVDIDEGRVAHIDEFQFPGAAVLPYSDMRSAMNHPAWYNPIGWFTSHKYDPDELEKGRLQIRDEYMDRGYLDVRVEPPVLEYPDKTPEEVTATVHVSEGTNYSVGKITVTGVSLYPEVELWELMKIHTGEVAAYNLIRSTSEAIELYYTSRGYLDTSVRWNLKPTAAGVVDVTFQVTEGKLARIRNVLVQGNTQTRDKVIRREVQVYPGEIYNEAKVKRSERRLMNLGYFSSARSHPVDTGLPGAKDAVFEVEEQRTGNLALGFGFSSIENLMGYAEVSQGNFDIAGWPFRGGGQKLKVGAQVSEKRQRYNVSFVEPWFMDRELRLGTDLYHSQVEYDDYKTRRTGGAMELSRGLPYDNRVGLEYRFERVVQDDLSDTNVYVYVDTGEPYQEEEYDRLESSMTLSLSHDTRNRTFFPSSGMRAKLAGTLYGGPLGFDTDMYSLKLSVSQYVPLWLDHVLSLRLEGEVVESYGRTEEVPITERLFLGGPYTLRGFDYRDVGPKVRRSHAEPNDDWSKPVGGDSMAMANVEYTIPLVKPLRFAAFYDIGNVWAEPYEFDFDELASSVGLGIRFDIPGFPMRFDYAWVLEKDDDYTREKRFSFTLGYGF